MAENGYGPVTGHVGRIPNYGKTQFNPMGTVEPPACIQNAMMTKDKKPFTYTPGGLDLSQIKTPSMVRRLARQRSLEEQEEAMQQQQSNGGSYHPQGGPAPPPPPPQAPAPPPPPPLVIEVAASNMMKPIPGERPEIVIPENPIAKLRKTNSPYHWEAEKAEMSRMGPVPKFVEKVPSPSTVQMPPSSFSQQPPQTFSQQPPQSYIPQAQNNTQRQSYPYQNQAPDSPVYKPEAQYGHQKQSSPNITPPTREMLQRQDSQFNKSPQPFGGQSPLSNGSTYSPSSNNNWKQPERRDSPVTSPQSPQYNRGPVQNTQQNSPNYQNQPTGNTGPVFHTLPRAGPRQDNYANNVPNNNYNNQIFNNTREARQASPNVDVSNPTPWRTSTLNRQPREPERQQNIYQNQNANQQSYSPPWKPNEANNNTETQSNYSPPWKQETTNASQPQQVQQPWVSQDSNKNKTAPTTAPFIQNQPQEQPRYQSTISIPVTQKKQNPQPDYNNMPPQKEAVYINQEPVYYCPDSPKSVPAWVRTQKEKTKTPPPEWIQRSLERRSVPRELVTPPRDTTNQEPEWVRRSNELQRNAREVISPPKYQQPVQPTWSTIPSENRKSLPRDNPPNQGNRTIPVQIDDGRQPPNLRVMIDTPQNLNAQARAQAPYSQPTQRIMRVLSPQLVKLDDSSQHDLPTLNRNLQSSQEGQPKTRIIPIQIEGGNGSSKQSFGGRY